MAESKSDILFGKSVFGGFDRKDVMEYIDTLQRRSQAKLRAELESAENRIAQLTAALETANAENACLQEEVLQLQAELKVTQTENALFRENGSSPKSIGDVDAMVHRNLG